MPTLIVSNSASAAVAAALGAIPLDLAAESKSWPPEVNAPKARLLVLERCFLFGRRPLHPKQLRQALFTPGTSRSFVVLSFLSEEWLKCYPGAALLNEPGVKFQRLPCTRSQIDDALNDAKMFDSEELAGMSQRVGTTIGQAQWSAQRFVEELRNGPDNPWLSRNLDELERLCQRRWRGCFERTFTELRQTVETHDTARAEEIATDFSERVVPASVYEAFAAFLHGAGKDVINRGPGPTLAALSVYATGAGMTFQQVESYLREHRWWDDFQLAFEDVQQQLEEVRAAGFNPDEYLPVRFENLEKALSAFAQFARDFSAAQVALNTLQRAREHLTILTDGIATIARAREFFRGKEQPCPITASVPSPDRFSEERRMLFVDDDYAQWSAILEAVAQQHHWQVQSVDSIEAARAELEQNGSQYDLILLDLGFPNQPIQGRAGVRRLHETARTIPIIVLTASNSAADIRTAVECLNQGAWEYFTKPDVDWLRLMKEADNLAAAGRLIRERIKALPNVPAEPLKTRVVFYIPRPKGEGLIDSLKGWLEDKYGGGTAAPHGETPATGIWKGIPDKLVLVWAFTNIEKIKLTHEAIFQKALELLDNLPQEDCLGVEVGTVFYIIDPEKIRVIPPLETAEVSANNGGPTTRVSKWPAL